MRSELILGAAFFAVTLGASGQVKVDDTIQTAGAGAALGAIGTAIVGAPIVAGAVVGAAGGFVYANLEEPIRISLR